MAARLGCEVGVLDSVLSGGLRRGQGKCSTYAGPGPFQGAAGVSQSWGQLRAELHAGLRQ